MKSKADNVSQDLEEKVGPGVTLCTLCYCGDDITISTSMSSPRGVYSMCVWVGVCVCCSEVLPLTLWTILINLASVSGNVDQ